MTVSEHPRLDAPESEDIESFRLRARAWLADNMPLLSADAPQVSSSELDQRVVDRARFLQRRLFDGGFAGLVFPRECGGQGLTPAHQHAFNEETVGYEMPTLFNIPTLSIIAPTLLEFGTEDQKQRYIEGILRGDELWVQFLSEPTGGSDLAGAVTRAERDGDAWVLNGAKTWSTFAIFCDYAMCLARTDWDAAKHGGLTMFLMKTDQPGVDVDWIKQSNGVRDFCQEFFTDVRLDAGAVIGEVNGGWAVASGLLNRERAAGGGSWHAHDGGGARVDVAEDGLVDLVRRLDPTDEHRLDLLGEAHTLRMVHRQVSARVSTGIQTGYYPAAAGALLRMSIGLLGARRATIGMELAASLSVSWRTDDQTSEFGNDYLFRQAHCLGGGSTEMQRNIISERLLGMPRERSEDRDRPFRDVPRTGK